MNHHNKICDGFADLSGKSFTPSYMRDDPFIHTCFTVYEGKDQPMGSLPNNQPNAK